MGSNDQSIGAIDATLQWGKKEIGIHINKSSKKQRFRRIKKYVFTRRKVLYVLYGYDKTKKCDIANEHYI